MSATFCNIGPTWPQIWPTRLQLGSKMAKLGFKLDDLGATSPQVELHMGSARETWPAQSEIAGVFTGISDVFWALMVLRVEQCSTCCASVGPNLVRSCRQSLPSGGMLDLTWTSMCVYVRHNWRQLGVLLAPRWGNLGPSSAKRAKGAAQAKVANLADSMRYFLRYFFGGSSCKAMLPTLGLSWAQLRRKMPLHRTSCKG
jgi:hypothetical protein